MNSCTLFKSALLLSCATLLATASLVAQEEFDLSGSWRFAIDREDRGATDRWWTRQLNDTIRLPGSMAESGKGDEITTEAQWAGGIVDKSWFTAERFARYRTAGNIKLPFGLTPNKVYQGAAWYQREVIVPPGWKGRRVLLHLERVHWESRLWVDTAFIGMQNSLATPHEYDVTEYMKPGNHVITLCIDNRIKDINIGRNAHSITDHTQTNWNGIIGDITLTCVPAITVDEIRVDPNVANRSIKVHVLISSIGRDSSAAIATTFSVFSADRVQRQVGRTKTLHTSLKHGNGEVETSIALGSQIRLWDEFKPALYKLQVSITGPGRVRHVKTVEFGLREFAVDGTRFHINGRPIFLRGTQDFCMFPQTGYPSMKIEDWDREFRIIRSFGLNHVRFHSWCPPEAAFVAADRLGLYLQIECGAWCRLGDGKLIDQWLYQESDRIVRAYGNHPSFCMMAHGNEPSGPEMGTYLAKFVTYWKQKDRRRVYTSGAGWPQIPESDYHSSMYPRIQVWGMGLSSIINREHPQTTFDFRDTIAKYNKPVVAHETGQWCSYPNLKEIEKYKGVLHAGNYEIVRDDLAAKGLLGLADSFLIASGKLQALCYKADIEAALRTPGMAGFQLLGLHDFPGQGTAPVGVLDFFSDGKGYITSEAFHRFCAPTVPLARMRKVIYTGTENFHATIEAAHFGANPLAGVIPVWTVSSASGKTLRHGALNRQDIHLGNAQTLGDVSFPLAELPAPARYRFSVSIGHAENSWDFWVYPTELPAIDTSRIVVTHSLDSAAIRRLKNGESVLLTLGKGRVSKDNGGGIALGFSSIFWNTVWTSGQAPHTLGILCDPSHPALADFPSEYHSNWQWWDAIAHADAMILDSLPHSLSPIIRVMDDWNTNRRLALAFEAKVESGRLLVCSIDLTSNIDHRPEARQLRYSILRYMSGPSFKPNTSVPLQSVVEMIAK